MALFPMSGVLRGLTSSTYKKVRLVINPCAALLIEKIAHFQLESKSALLQPE
jgi:hypothetical protein